MRHIKLTDAASVDRLIAEVQAETMPFGFDPRKAELAIRAGLSALAKQAEALNATDWSAMTRPMRARCPKCDASFTLQVHDPVAIAKGTKQTAEMIDDTFRLASFAHGQPDSRPDRGGDWLRALTPEQLQIVQGWLEGKP